MIKTELEMKNMILDSSYMSLYWQYWAFYELWNEVDPLNEWEMYYII